MKKLFFLPVVLFALSVFVSSCSSTPSSPEGVAEAYLEAMQSKNIDKVKSFIKDADSMDESSWKNLEALFSAPEFQIENIKIGEVSVNEAGDSADVDVTCVIAGQEMDQTIELELVEDKWLVVE